MLTRLSKLPPFLHCGHASLLIPACLPAASCLFFLTHYGSLSSYCPSFPYTATKLLCSHWSLPGGRAGGFTFVASDLFSQNSSHGVSLAVFQGSRALSLTSSPFWYHFLPCFPPQGLRLCQLPPLVCSQSRPSPAVEFLGVGLGCVWRGGDPGVFPEYVGHCVCSWKGFHLWPSCWESSPPWPLGAGCARPQITLSLEGHSMPHIISPGSESYSRSGWRPEDVRTR